MFAVELVGQPHVASGWLFGALLLALREVAEEACCGSAAECFVVGW